MAKLKNQFAPAIEDYSTGLITSLPAHLVPKGGAVENQNIVLDNKGKLGIRLGCTDFSTGLTGSYAINSAISFNTKAGDEIAIIADAGGNLWWRSKTDTTNSWYKLKSGMTAGKKWGFKELNTTTYNQVYGGNGTDYFSYWKVAVTNLTAAVTAGATTINVTSTADFPATGTIIYNGTEIAYSGKAATTFTVVSAHTSAGATDGVANKFDTTTYTTQPLGNIFTLYQDRLYVAGNDNLISGSVSGTYTDFTTTGVGCSVLINIVEGKGNIKGLDVQDEKMIALKSNAIIPIAVTQPELSMESVNIKPIIIGENAGTENFQAVSGSPTGNLFFASNDGGIKELSNVIMTEKLKPLQLSDSIQDTLKQWVMTDSKLAYNQQQFLLAAKETSGSSSNDIIQYINIRGGKKFISIIKGWNVGAWFTFDNKLRFGSSGNETKVFTTFDGYDDNGVAINAIWTGKRENFGLPFKKKHEFYYAIKGEISENTILHVFVRWDGGTTFTKEYVINGDGTSNSFGSYVNGALSYGYGSIIYGNAPYGGNVEDGMKEFIGYLPLPNNVSGYDIQVTYQSSTAGARWKILSESVSIKELDMIPKRRKISST